MAVGASSDATRASLAAAVFIVLCLCLALCLGSGLLVAAWVEVPAVHGNVAYIYVCVGVNLNGHFRVGVGWASNLAYMVPVTTALPQALCGYWPRPPFVGEFGLHIFQP